MDNASSAPKRADMNAMRYVVTLLYSFVNAVTRERGVVTTLGSFATLAHGQERALNPTVGTLEPDGVTVDRPLGRGLLYSRGTRSRWDKP